MLDSQLFPFDINSLDEPMASMTQPIRFLFSGLSRIALLVGVFLFSAALAAPSSMAQDESVPVITEDEVDGTLETGDTFTKEISVQNLDQADDINAVDLTLDFGDAPVDVSSVNVGEGTLLDGFLTDTGTTGTQVSISGASQDALGGGANSGVLAEVVFEVTDGSADGTVTFPDVRFNDVNAPDADLSQADFDVITSDTFVRIENAVVRTTSTDPTVEVSASDLSSLGITNFDIEIEVGDPGQDLVALDGDNPVDFLSADLANEPGVDANYNASTNVLSISGVTQDGLAGGEPLFDLNVDETTLDDGETVALSFLGGTEFRDNSGDPVDSDPDVDLALSNGQLQVFANGAPSASADRAETTEDEVIEVTDPANGVLANDTDPEGDSLTASLVSDVSQGNLSLNGDGTFAYDPNDQFEDLDPGQSATETFTYEASDGFGGTDQATVTISIEGVEDETITAIPDTTIDEDTSTDPIEFAVDDGDPNTDPSDLSVDGQSNDQGLVPDDSIEFGGSGADRTVTVTPSADSFGTATITVTATDPEGSQVSEDFLLAVNSINDAPVAVDDSYPNDDVEEVLEDDTLEVKASNGLLANDRHPDRENFTVSEALVSAPDNGSVDVSANGSFEYIPNADFAGTDQFVYQVSDGDSTDTALVDINVEQVNDAPTISEVADQNIGEDEQAGPVSFTVGDLETSPSDLSVGVSSNNADLVPDDSIEIGGEGADRTVTVTPSSDSFGTATIELAVTDQEIDGKAPETTTESFELTVDPVNDAPVARADTFSTPEDSTLTVEAPGVLENDSDVESATLTASVVSEPSDGSLTLEEDGAFTYDPNEGFTGTDNFEYEAIDEGDSSDVASVQIEVEEDTDPSISGLDDASTTINENESAGPIGFTVEDTETAPENLALEKASSDTSLVPTDSIEISGSGADRELTVTPSANSNGSADITITVVDEGQNTDSQTFTLTVDPVNTPPVISGLPEADTIDEDGSTGPISFLVGDVETDSASIEVSGSSSNTGLLPDDGIELSSQDGGERQLTATPAPDSNGTAEITVTARDADGASTEDTLTLQVESVPDAPVAVNDTFSVDQGGELTRSVADGLLANDFDPDGDSFEATTFPLESPANGDASISANGSFRYAPEEGFSGTDQFTYRIEDNTGRADTATVTVNVETVDVTISGTVSYPGEGDSGLTDGRPLGGVPVDVSTLSGDVAARDTTGSDGTFSVTVQSGEYVVEGRPEATLDVPSEINATDASRTVQAFLGNDPFAGDFQQEVADVNESGSVNATDALKMALFFGNPGETTFEAGEWAATSRTVDVTGGTDADVSVLAAAYGDANLSGGEESAGGTVAARSNATDGSAAASAAEASGESDLRSVGTEKTFEVPVRLDRGAEISSYSLQVGFPAETVSFEGVSGTERDVIASAENGTVRLSWFDRSGESPMQLGSGSSVVTLRFRADASAEKGAVFSPEIMAGELAGPSAEPLQGASLATESVKIGSVLPEEFALKGNYPNPISSGQATIEMDLPSKASVTVEVYNTLGQKVQTVERSMAAGAGQTVRVDGSRLASGQYFYRVRADLGDSTTEETGQITVVR